MRAAMLEYLRDKASQDERKAVLKAALNEWFDARFGVVWFSFQMVVAIIFCYLVYLYLTGPSSAK